MHEGRRQTTTRAVANWTLAPFPVAPWDPTDLPPRTLSERCAHHRYCAYRDDDPSRCQRCHSSRCPRCQKCHSSRCRVVVEYDVVEGSNVAASPTFSSSELVRVQRDEIRNPSRGTWPQFRGRAGTVVEINLDHKRPYQTEYGVVFGKVAPRIDGRGNFIRSGNEPITWFKAHEIVSWEAAEGHADGRKTAAEASGAQQDYGLAQ